MVRRLKWTDKFKVGIAWLDADHVDLVGLINEFIAASNAPEPMDRLLGLFDRVVEATRSHFERENVFIMQTDIVNKDHLTAHDNLIGDLLDLRASLEATTTQPERDRLSIDLKDWFARHAIEFDSTLRSYYYDYMDRR